MSLLLVILVSLGAFFAALLSGSVGSGGGLLLLPILSAVFGVQIAVPILTSVQIVSNASRAYFSFRHINWHALLWFASIAIPGTVLGAFAFIHLDKGLTMRLIGFMLLVYLAISVVNKNEGQQSKKAFFPFAALAGFLSGMIGTAGPLGPAAFLSLNLAPLEFIATDATCSLILHLVKLAIYKSCLNIPASVCGLSLILAIVTVAGSWYGKKFAQLISVQMFRRLVMVALTVSATMLVVHV